MKTALIGAVSLAGLVATANAQVVYETNTTRMFHELSTDGVNWSSSVNFSHSMPFAFRIRFVYTGSEAVSKLVEARYQPTIRGWMPGDVLAPFHNAGGGTNTSFPRGSVSPSNSMPVSVHKVHPFASTGQIASGAGNLTSFISGTTLRIAGSNSTNAPGQGSGGNNVNGLFGVISSQLAQNGDPSSTQLGTDVVVFKGTMTTSSNGIASSRVFTTDALSLMSIPMGGSEFARGVYWLRSGSSSSTGDIRSSVIIEPAYIVAPTPTGLSVALAGCIALTRRRSR